MKGLAFNCNTLAKLHLISRQRNCLQQRRCFFDKIFPSVYDTLRDPSEIDVLSNISQWSLHNDKDYGGTSECSFRRGELMYIFFHKGCISCICCHMDLS